MPRPLYFLTHDGNPAMFSAYGIPLRDGDKSPLLGMLLAERGHPSTEEYIQNLKSAFEDVQVGPMTSKGDRGVYAQMRIDDPVSLGLEEKFGIRLASSEY